MAQPEKRFKAGACTASIFANEVQTADGIRTVRNVVLQRTFKDKDGNWQSTSSFSATDVPKAMLVMQRAFEHLVLDSEAKSQPGDQNG